MPRRSCHLQTPPGTAIGFAFFAAISLQLLAARATGIGFDLLNSVISAAKPPQSRQNRFTTLSCIECRHLATDSTL
jgi:hypothetical protein